MIDPSTEYAGKITAPNAAYPFGSARNIVVPGDGLGTPLEKEWVNDVYGFFQSVVAGAGDTPNGSADSVTNPQILNAVKRAKEFQDLTEMKSIAGAYDKESRFLIEYGSTGDRAGAGVFVWKAGSTATPDDALVVQLTAGGVGRWIRVVSGLFNAKWFGIVGDGSADDTTQIAVAIASIEALGGGSLFFPSGTYKMTTSETFGTQAAPVNVVMDIGAKFTSTSVITLSFNRFEGQIDQHFTLNTIASFKAQSITECYPQWWGAVCDGATDDAPAIQRAFDQMPDYTTMRFPLAEIASTVGASLYYKIDSTIEIANKEGCRFIFSGKGDTAVPAVSTYPIRYEGSALITYENPVFREVGNNQCLFEGLGIDAGGNAEFGAWFSGINAYPRYPASANADTIDASTVAANAVQSALHQFSSGDTVVYNDGGGTSIVGLTSTVTYFIIRVDANTYSLALTLADAVAFTPVVITISAGVGVLHTFTWQTKTLTGVFNRSIGCRVIHFRTIGTTVCGARVGESNSTPLGSSQTDIGTFASSYFSAPEASIQIPLDAEPGTEHPDIPGQAVTFGLNVVGPNTVVAFYQCESTGDWSINITSGSVSITEPLFLGDSGIYINDRTSYVNITAFHAEGLKGRGVLTGTSDGAGARNISITNGIMLPAGKSTVTIPTGDVDVGTDTITAASHDFVTGDRLFYEDNGTPIGGLTDETVFYCIRVNANSYQVALNIVDANAGTQIDLTGTGNSAQTFTWRPAPMRFRSNQNVSLIAIEAEDWITDNAGSVGQKAVIIDSGCQWLHPTDHSNNPDLKAFRYSVEVSGDIASQLLYMPGLKKQFVDESGGPKTLTDGWSDVDVKGVEDSSGNAITLHDAHVGMFLRIWKLGEGTLTVNKATSGNGQIIRHDTNVAVASDVKAASLFENGHILFTCLDEGEWRVSSDMGLNYDSGFKYLTADTTWNPGNLTAGSTTAFNIAVTDADVGDFVQISHDQIASTDLLLFGTAQLNNVRATLYNPTGGPVDLPDGILRVKVTKF